MHDLLTEYTFSTLAGVAYFWLYQPGESVTILCNIAADYTIWRGPGGEVIVNTTVIPAILNINPTDSSHGGLYTCQAILTVSGVTQSANVNFFAVSKCICIAVFYNSLFMLDCILDMNIVNSMYVKSYTSIDQPDTLNESQIPPYSS